VTENKSIGEYLTS
jgi:hypothetical protein